MIKGENNLNINNSNNNDLDYDDGIVNNDDENLISLNEKTNNLNLSEEKEIESYDESCEDNGIKNKRKKSNYNKVNNSIMDSLSNFVQNKINFGPSLKLSY